MLNRLATQAPLQVSFYCLILIPFPLFLLPSHPCHSAQLSIIRLCGPISTCPPPSAPQLPLPSRDLQLRWPGNPSLRALPPSPPAISGIQLLMTVMPQRGEVDRLRIQCTVSAAAETKSGPPSTARMAPLDLAQATLCHAPPLSSRSSGAGSFPWSGPHPTCPSHTALVFPLQHYPTCPRK